MKNLCFQNTRRPQWIVHPIVTYHDTLCGKAGLEKDDCRKAEQHENKTAWDSTISVIGVLVYLETDKENPRLGRELPAYRLVPIKNYQFSKARF